MLPAVSGPSLFLYQPPPQEEGPPFPHTSPQRRAPPVHGAPHLRSPFFRKSAAPSVDELIAAEALLLLQPPSFAAAAGPTILRREQKTEQQTPFLAAPKEEIGKAAVEAVLIDLEEGNFGIGGPSGPAAFLVKHFSVHVPTLEPEVTTRQFDVRRARSERLAFAKPNTF